MLEAIKTQQTPQPIEAFEHAIEVAEGDARSSGELIQFSDASTAMLSRMRGQRLAWEIQKHARPNHYDNCTILTMANGKRIGVGAGVMATLPELDRDTGRFRSDTDPAAAGVSAIEVSQMAPKGLPDAVVGENWPLATDDGPVESIMTRYKQHRPGTVEEQVAMPSHLESAMQLLRLAAYELSPDEDFGPPQPLFDDHVPA